MSQKDSCTYITSIEPYVARILTGPRLIQFELHLLQGCCECLKAAEFARSVARLSWPQFDFTDPDTHLWH